jgi:hypothetical protein
MMLHRARGSFPVPVVHVGTAALGCPAAQVYRAAAP